jgi:hypothetical protein
VSQQTIRIRPPRAGRRVRWTFEVSADVGGENGARTRKTLKKRPRAKRAVKQTRLSDSHRGVPVVIEPVQPAKSTALEVLTMAKTPASAENVTPPAKSPAIPPSTPVRRMTRPRRVALACVAVLIVAGLALVRRLAEPGANAPADNRPERVEQAANVAPISPPVPLAPAVRATAVAAQAIKQPPKKAAASRREQNRIAESPKSASPIEPATPLASVTKLAAPEPMTVAPEPPSASTGSVGHAPVTITGCLEISVNEDEFRLTDTEGVDAPKSRSWRTGFLKKRSPPVALVEPPDRQALQTQVGKRVAATGLLTSRELKVSSLRVVGPSCN